MPRPARAIWVPRRYARRRHRSWMLSMTLASFGWGTWWILLFVRRLAPGIDVGLTLPSVVSTVFALLGLGVAVLTVRARKSWLIFTTVPLLANTSLLVVPWLASNLAARGPE